MKPRRAQHPPRAGQPLPARRSGTRPALFAGAFDGIGLELGPRDLSRIIELRALLSSCEPADARVLELLDAAKPRLAAFLTAFRQHHKIDLEEILVAGFKSFGSKRLELLSILYSRPLASVTHELFQGLS